ncbi:MAG: glycine cleavage system protein GcvH [Bryobacteraceae bacterium]
MYPDQLRYTKEHEWVRLEGDLGTIGITDHAQKELGDIVFAELPRVGTRIERGKTLGSVESVKAVSEVCAPVSGEVVEVNEALAGTPETINADPHGGGWLVKMRLSAPQELDSLLSAADYEAYIAAEK